MATQNLEPADARRASKNLRHHTIGFEPKINHRAQLFITPESR
jgi:hypothetical protein